jgi:hypothetical protein
MIFHFDNATPHTAMCMIDYLRASRLTREPPPIYFTGFGTMRFLHVRQTENGVDGCIFADNDQLLQGVMEVLNGISREEFEAVVEEWI